MLIFSGGCLRKRTWSIPSSAHLHYEIEIEKNTGETTAFSYAITDKEVLIKLKKTKKCNENQYAVESLSMIETVQYPLSRYYFMIGAVLASLSLPSYYMAFFQSEGTSSAVQAGIGTGVFLAPGIILGSYGFLKMSEEKTEKNHIGNTRRKIKTREYICGSGAVKSSSRVEILTGTGHEIIGKTNKKGEISFVISRYEPLQNEKNKYKYFELVVDGISIGKIKLGNIPSKK
ncbi:MAG: hypothetical protein JXR95_05330 [Deltaproteobacteria bacterium]|nr:hypothetical protein [Deltaproteobacteria bacterium]